MIDSFICILHRAVCTCLSTNWQSTTTRAWKIKAPSTGICICLKTHLFLSVLGSRPHGDGVFGHRKRSFSKALSRVDLFENTVFTLSRGCVKTELFENAGVTASIYNPSEHHARAFCLSVFFHRSSNAEYHYRLWNFVIKYRIVNVTAFSCGRGSFFKRIKKCVFKEYLDTCGRGLSLWQSGTTTRYYMVPGNKSNPTLT